MNLRDYQHDCVQAIESAWQTHDRVLAVLPTGCGKTEIFVRLASDWQQGRVLVVAPMIELVGQAARKLTQRTGIAPGIEQGQLRSNENEYMRSPFVVASKQTLTGKARRYMRLSDIGLVIVDEAHLAATKIYKEMLDHFSSKGAKILGVTATPKRHDGVGLHNLFDHCAYELSIDRAIGEGWLVAPRAQCVRLKSLDLSSVRSNRDDFVQSELAKAMGAEKVVHEIAEVTAREYQGEKTVVFCASVAEARGVAELLADRHGVKAGWVCGDESLCDKQTRRQVLDDFTQGDLAVVANVGVLTTGWDFPGLQHIVMARPTKSQPLFVQILGRGMRPLPGVVDFEGSNVTTRRDAIAASDKPFWRVTDLRDNSNRHCLISTVDVLGGSEISEAARAYVRKKAEDGPIDVARELDKAEAQMRLAESKRKQREAEEQARRQRALIAARAEYEKRDADLFRQSAVASADSDKNRMVVPFGRFKGYQLWQTPEYWLKWFTQQPWAWAKYRRLAGECRKELASRGVSAGPAKKEEAQLDFFSRMKVGG